jgi:hypothetical protein
MTAAQVAPVILSPAMWGRRFRLPIIEQSNLQELKADRRSLKAFIP